MNDNLKVIGGKGKGKVQQVQGLMVQMIGGVFEFNFQTAFNPAEDDIEMLKEFRNEVVLKLEILNTFFEVRQR